MNTSQEIDKVSAALVLAQQAMLPLIKDSDNPFYKSKYADLHAVTQACYPALQANGICIIQSAESLGSDGINIRTRLLHSSGQFIETECAIPPAGQDPQKYGSAVTYGRRYGLQAAVGLAATDDDAEAAMGRKESKFAPASKPVATNDHGKPEAAKPASPPASKPNDDGMVDKIINSFLAQKTVEDLQAKMDKARTTPYGNDPRVVAAFNNRMFQIT